MGRDLSRNHVYDFLDGISSGYGWLWPLRPLKLDLQTCALESSTPPSAVRLGLLGDDF